MPSPLATFERESLGWNGSAVLTDLSLRIDAGERVALLGRSGSGKSTLLDALRRRMIGERIALVPQQHGLVDPLSVFHNVWMGQLDQSGTLTNLRTLLWPLARERAAVDVVLDRIGLSDMGRRNVTTMSGGQRQRVALGRALLRGGAVVLADEPVSALDPTQGDALLADLANQFETSVLALHDVGQALSFATRIIGLRASQIVIDAPADELDTAALMDLYR